MTRRPQSKGEIVGAGGGELRDSTLVRIVRNGWGGEQERRRVLRSLPFQESLANGGRYLNNGKKVVVVGVGHLVVGSWFPGCMYERIETKQWAVSAGLRTRAGRPQ